MDRTGTQDHQMDNFSMYWCAVTCRRRRTPGLKATTHWLALDALKQFGAIPTKERVVRQGKVFTAAGVSLRIAMALTVVAEEFGLASAQCAQLLIE